MTDQLVRQDAINTGFNTAGEMIGAGKTIQSIQTQYATAVAVQKPRDLAVVADRCVKEARLAGESCFYGWGVGKDRIEGPSINCAMIAVRNFGNCVLEMRPPVETATAYVFEAAFVDLETGFTYSRQFRQSKRWTVHGKMDNERKDDVRFQIGQSKAARNCALKALPQWLLDKMMETAKSGVKEKIEAKIKKGGIEAARKGAADSLGKFGVSVERIELKYGKYATWDVDTLVMLVADVRALADGVESADVLFPEHVDEDPAATSDGGGVLSPEQMHNGDPATHQGHETKKSADDF